MCTEKQFNTVYSVLVDKKEVDRKSLPESLNEIPEKDLNDAIERLHILGFVDLLHFFNGVELIELTKKGRQMYKAVY